CSPCAAARTCAAENAGVNKAQVDGKDSSELSHAPGVKPATKVGEQGESVPGPVTERRSEVGHGGGAPNPQPQLSAASNELQEGTNDKKNTESGTSSSSEQRNKSEEDSAQKTTTTTTTQAPSATTGAPTTTTTHTPLRLREIDGSLSSSAWVCAPLLLAVSALAYTAVG
ncbi:mucin TcMUCII, partial [Trypanosoma cruzi]